MHINQLAFSFYHCVYGNMGSPDTATICISASFPISSVV